MTNAQGEYVFTQLELETYSVTIEALGFKELQRPGVIVGTQETVSVDVRLEGQAIFERQQSPRTMQLAGRPLTGSRLFKMARRCSSSNRI